MMAAPMSAPARHADHHVEDGSSGNQLAGEDGERANRGHQRRDASDGGVVAKLQVVAGGVEVVLLGEAPQPRPDPEGEHERGDAGGADPPPGGNPFAIRPSGPPTVEPAPMFDASIDARMSPGPRSVRRRRSRCFVAPIARSRVRTRRCQRSKR